LRKLRVEGFNRKKLLRASVTSGRIIRVEGNLNRGTVREGRNRCERGENAGWVRTGFLEKLKLFSCWRLYRRWLPGVLSGIRNPAFSHRRRVLADTWRKTAASWIVRRECSVVVGRNLDMGKIG